jgi:hypothetical protein
VCGLTWAESLSWEYRDINILVASQWGRQYTLKDYT